MYYAISKIVIIFLITILTFVKTEPPISSNYGVPSYNGGGGGSYSGAGANGGYYGGGSYNDQGHYEDEAPKSYEFGYAVKDDYSGNDYGRKETSDGHVVQGEYRVNLPDGRIQIVTYYADWKTGYHADVRYEGEAIYPQQNNYGASSGQYGAPAPGYNRNQYSGGSHGGY